MSDSSLSEDQRLLLADHMRAAWPVLLAEIRRGIDNGHDLSEMAILFADFPDAQAIESARRSRGFASSNAVATVKFRSAVEQLASSAHPSFGEAMREPAPPGVIRVFAITVIGPFVASMAFDPNVAAPTIGSA